MTEGVYLKGWKGLRELVKVISNPITQVRFFNELEKRFSKIAGVKGIRSIDALKDYFRKVEWGPEPRAIAWFCKVGFWRTNLWAREVEEDVMHVLELAYDENKLYEDKERRIKLKRKEVCK